MDAETVVRTYSDMIYGIALHYTANPTDAEDVYSEVFLIYFKKDRSFESEEHRKAWLIKVTINAAKTFLMNKNPNLELNEEIAGSEEASISIDERLDLQDAIEKLPPAYKEVIFLFYIQELSIKQISEITKKTESNVKVLLSRAREKLKNFLEN